MEAPKVPRRPFGSRLSKRNLPAELPLVGLGCSSFSSFFWTPEEQAKYGELTVDTITPSHPKVQEWMETIRYAVLECGMDLLDTAPWYGHGTSEMVIGFALQKYPELKAYRSKMTINTKVGRYEADFSKQFDFGKETTLRSVDRSIQRMQCDYIDVLQLHDPEFAPTLEILMEETLPAMIQAKQSGKCKALGMTGYPLQVQYQILQRVLEVFGENNNNTVFDQALTYGHFNLHNQRLIRQPMSTHSSYADYCAQHGMGLLAAAPLSMGLLTPPNEDGKFSVPAWHPASESLKDACEEASMICSKQSINIASLATLYALSEPRVAATIIGCKNVSEVQRAAEQARRFQDDCKDVFTESERKVLQQLQDATNGPFAKVWKADEDHWDGIQEVRQFYSNLSSVDKPAWQAASF